MQRKHFLQYFLIKRNLKLVLGAAEGKDGWNPHWSGTSAASLISYSATPRVFRRICLGAEPKT